ncbi:MAG: CDP-alcohol phosphatidyltransferase family protein [Bacteroidales bacterium]|nr:CDP-alcohol phosphatidyltransferase family protein [Bacteroidales bacterium]
MSRLPNIISASRAATAVIMLFFPVFSVPFWLIYSWCGLSDMIDGPIARKMNAESELGSRIDSLADLVFVVCACIMILPAITLPVWIWIWVAAIGIAKTVAICIGSSRQHRLAVPHSRANKLTGLLLFCLPFALIWLDPVIPSIIVCAVATLSVK